MQVKLRLKSIEPVKLDQGLTITYVASSQQLGKLELRIVIAMQADLNAAEQEARKTIDAFATGLRIAAESSPLVGQKISETPGITRFSGGCNAAESGSALQEATVSERRLLTCAAYCGSTGTIRTCQRTNSRSDSRYASRPGR